MNKRIKAWYTALMIAELLAAVYLIIWFFAAVRHTQKPWFDSVSEVDLMTCAGIMLPILAAFIGVCAETRYKRIKAMPTATGIPLVFSLFGLIWIQLHPRVGFFAGFHDIPHELFYIICGSLSFFLFLSAIDRALDIRKDKYDEFLAMPEKLFTGRSVLLLIPLTILTAVWLIPAIYGYFITL